MAQTVTADAADEFGLPECTVGATYHGEPVYVAELVTDWATFQGRISAIRHSEVTTVADGLPQPTAVELVRHGNRETRYAAMGLFGPGSVVIVNPWPQVVLRRFGHRVLAEPPETAYCSRDSGWREQKAWVPWTSRPRSSRSGSG